MSWFYSSSKWCATAIVASNECHLNTEGSGSEIRLDGGTFLCDLENILEICCHGEINTGSYLQRNEINHEASTNIN